MPHFGEHWDDNEFPLAYLITIRTFGTWLHGDERGAVDTQSRYNLYGAVKRPSDPGLERRMRENMHAPPFILDQAQRSIVDAAISEVCARRQRVQVIRDPSSQGSRADLAGLPCVVPRAQPTLSVG